MEISLNSFIYSNFNYCPLVWRFSSCKSTAKIEKIHKGCLRMVLNDNTSDYQTLLEKSKKSLSGNEKAKKRTLESRIIVLPPRLLIFRFFFTQDIFIPTLPIINFQSFLLTFLTVNSHSPS